MKVCKTEEPSTVALKSKLVPQNSVDCYVKMESVVDSPLSPRFPNTTKGDSLDGHGTVGMATYHQGATKSGAVLTTMESSLEFGGAIETSLEFGATRGISLDFGGSPPSVASPRGEQGESFRMNGEGGGGLELESHARGNRLSSDDTYSKTTVD